MTLATIQSAGASRDPFRIQQLHPESAPCAAGRQPCFRVRSGSFAEAGRAVSTLGRDEGDDKSKNSTKECIIKGFELGGPEVTMKWFKLGGGG